MTFLEFLGTAGASGLVTAGGGLMVKLYRARSANHVTEVDKAAELSREVAEDVRKDLAQMKVDLASIRDAHLACREENAGLKVKVEALVKENTDLRSEVQVMSRKLDQLLAAGK
jgi:predicted  nucleic acid-binding Zn-ribbon protein